MRGIPVEEIRRGVGEKGLFRGRSKGWERDGNGKSIKFANIINLIINLQKDSNVSEELKR